jgi:predicted dehydrogenase
MTPARSPPWRAAVLGLGLGLHRANGYLQNSDTVLVAVCDTDAERLRAFTETQPEVRGYADYAEMLRREAPEIVNVSTPDWMHLEHARQALAAKAHVLLEKPMVTSLAEAEALIEAVEGSAIGRVGVAYAPVLPRGTVSPTLELYGTRGTYATGRLYTGAPGADDWETPAPPAVKDSFASEVDHFVACLQSGTPFDVDVREGARNVAACLAAVEAMRTGLPVRPQQF